MVVCRNELKLKLKHTNRETVIKFVFASAPGLTVRRLLWLHCRLAVVMIADGGMLLTNFKNYTGPHPDENGDLRSVAPERIWKWGREGHRSGTKLGGTDSARSAGKYCLVMTLHFLALKAQLVVLVSSCVMVSTVRSISCSLFFYSRCPPVPSHL